MKWFLPIGPNFHLLTEWQVYSECDWIEAWLNDSNLWVGWARSKI